MKKYLLLILSSIIIASCGTQKSAVSTSTTIQQQETAPDNKAKLDYLHKVYDNAVYATNIVSKIDLTLDALGKDITLDGKICMRKNEVVRIVITPFGLMEVGRLEFTPDYVLIVDRMHKTYAKATYNDLDFLQVNGLNFYALQSLFWNELFVPGEKKVGETQLRQFDVDLKSADRNVTMTSGKLAFTWATDPANAHITAANVDYGKGSSAASTAKWTYGKFVDLGKKQFPSTQTLSFRSNSMKAAGALSMKISMSKITQDNNWEALTDVSGKYDQLSIEEIFSQLMSL